MQCEQPCCSSLVALTPDGTASLAISGRFQGLFSTRTVAAHSFGHMSKWSARMPIEGMTSDRLNAKAHHEGAPCIEHLAQVYSVTATAGVRNLHAPMKTQYNGR